MQYLIIWILVILPWIYSRCFYNDYFGCFFSLKKGYKLTRQGKSIFKMGWRQVTSERQGGKMLSTMEMESDSSAKTETNTLSSSKRTSLVQKRGDPLFSWYIFACINTILLSWIPFEQCSLKNMKLCKKMATLKKLISSIWMCRTLVFIIK